ncbi:MAG: PfkB family carbohydrate kinase [Christensenellaceae bacterium]|jgi:ribokinase|nr:PfkB family carbohydrate kinase [Christensenellaceae bacterium]
MGEKTITVVGHYGMSLLMDVEHFPTIGETVEGIGLETEPGGKGYNQAIAASRLGAHMNFITAVGDDDFGRSCDKDLRLEGVTGRYIEVFPGKKTACAFVINSAAKESSVYVYPGAIRDLGPAEIKKYTTVLEGSALVLLPNEISPEALQTVLGICGGAGVPIIYNPAPAREMPTELLKYVTILTPNETEAAILTGQDPNRPLDVPMALAKLAGYGIPNVLITLGQEGSILRTPTGDYKIDAMKVEAVSTTGAGDSFNAALAVHFLETGDILASAEYAAVASGLQVMRPGVIANMPYKKEADAFYERVRGQLSHRV